MQWPGRRTKRTRSVRFKLLAIALLPTLVILPLLLGVMMVRWNSKFDALLTSKVNGDLTIAHQYFTHILETTGEQIEALGQSVTFRDVLTSGDRARIDDLLAAKRAELGLDFLYIANRQGIVSGASPRQATPRLDADWPVIATALSGASLTGVDIFDNADLAAISPDLAARAQLDLVPTPNAVPTTRDAETRGMVVHSASHVSLPMVGPEDIDGALVGGILLNQNLVFIDTINDLVYRESSLPEGSQGTATLFLDDVRISTNVRLFEGRRALGTRVSSAVRQNVLEDGKVWLDSAFVVNDWYISAYEPIVDSFGDRVGMLYVGFLEAPFAQTKYESLLIIIVAFLFVATLSVPIFLRWARGIFKPLERMTQTIARVESGDFGARTHIDQVQDEISLVAEHLDDLLDQVQERDKRLRAWNEELNARVDARTSELREANRQLEATTKQLIMSEKLAAIGEITAGVAHEINNPVAVLQGNLDVVRDLLGENVRIAETEFRLIDEQVSRINLIVTKLLQFAKPEEYAGFVERHSPGEVIGDCLPLVQHLLNKADIEVARESRARRLILMNRTELQQVVVNLMVNALHAMPGSGTLTLIDEDFDRNGKPGIRISIRDTGTGMSSDILGRIFDPFYTTKRREGTGLGLSISKTLIDRQGGAMAVESEPGKGTLFTIWLPEAD
ncbi:MULTISPECIES: cache domain-containing protein [Thalassospira]|mgnify:FL=1|jgi:signal transduction histidine kinase|uniref:histidine kinase n=1 Tax=Thalassospira xiamenensis TaxID=220697 RepID=A0ABR5XXG7_9PROT|nr:MULTISPECIES: cache domain-containing protein [Thalassospira]MAL29163.1 sensor histidine kinase [Thalassospira sp.]MBR9781272.1 HAMP domain-containing protein [Rhodospirillales bacterium]KZC99583.1 histidine kinase [Thalassospira xiamenensis]KZD09047.1 histidine kinase [Thalassospira xiamenensis]MBL4839962.1 cache domain-containing protein [Thalassospira sp.]|tara:strand:+ start:11052 stop:13079 length:2028 start_codon:yes stop_codon:yes gene_type:complete